MSSEQKIDLNVDVTANFYYLYRQAGCPFGDNVAGLEAWYRVNILQPFEDLADRETK